MASSTIYAPIVDSYVPAFIASGGTGTCRLYFSLSKYSTSSIIKSVHVSVIRQTTGQSVVRKSDSASSGRYRSTGIIIINSAPIKVADQSNLYYVDITGDDVQAGDEDGWYPGWIYKLQVRLSSVAYPGGIGQSAWLTANGNNFSEWSTYCTAKATGQPNISIPLFYNYNSATDGADPNKEKKYNLYVSTLNFTATYSNTDTTETLYSYRLQLCKDDANESLLEDSGVLYSNQYSKPNLLTYLFKREMQDNDTYIVKLSYTTINKYEESMQFGISITQTATEKTKIVAVTSESLDYTENESFIEDFQSKTFDEQECEEGRIAIKFFSNDATAYNGNLCLRRAEDTDNFVSWTDIKIVICIDTPVNGLPMMYDYTAESGKWYKYGVQTIDTNGNRGIMNYVDTPVIREWTSAFLLGEGGRQLNLKYDNTMNSYAYNVLESKTDTFGSKYPFISRLGNTRYRTFPINGLISFNMDEQTLFTSDSELYSYRDVIENYQERRNELHLGNYDYKREHDFREKVLEFLYDGKPKLFKSATEGNVIVRLMSVSAQPNQTLGRMIYSFTSTAHEMAEATMSNYENYGFYEVGEWSSSFAQRVVKLGQVDFEYSPGENVIEKIWYFFDHSSQNQAGSRISLTKMHHLSLEFCDDPLRVQNNAGEVVLGNNFEYNGTSFTVRADRSRTYVFDEDIQFTDGDVITVLGGLDDIYDEDGNVKNTIHIIANFLYEIDEEPYQEKQIETTISGKGVGQYKENVAPNTNIYNELYYKYYYEWDYQYRKLNRISAITLEANPKAVFSIQDEDSADATEFDINYTGVLDFDGITDIQAIKYVGVRNEDGTIDKTKNCDVCLDYLYYLAEGTYKE